MVSIQEPLQRWFSWRMGKFWSRMLEIQKRLYVLKAPTFLVMQKVVYYGTTCCHHLLLGS